MILLKTTRKIMFKKNNNPDYYNDAIKDARVNAENINNQSNTKGKLLLILNLLLISAMLGYFIYQNFLTNNNSKTAVRGVNYTVDIHEEKSSDNATHHTKLVIDNISKEKLSSDLKKIINNSNQENSSYVNALDNELIGKSVKNSEEKHKNRELENILADIDTKGFSQTTNVVRIDNEALIDRNLDLNELANMVNALVLEEQLKSSSYEKQLNK
jgi:hypothetical protein